MYTRGFAYGQYNAPYPVHPQPSPHTYRSYIYNPPACPFNTYPPSNPPPCSTYGNHLASVGYTPEPIRQVQELNRVLPPPIHGSHVPDILSKEKEIFPEPIEKLTENYEKGKSAQGDKRKF